MGKTDILVRDGPGIRRIDNTDKNERMRELRYQNGKRAGQLAVLSNPQMGMFDALAKGAGIDFTDKEEIFSIDTDFVLGAVNGAREVLDVQRNGLGDE